MLKYNPSCPHLQAVANKTTCQSLRDRTKKYTCYHLLVNHYGDLATWIARSYFTICHIRRVTVLSMSKRLKSAIAVLVLEQLDLIFH